MDQITTLKLSALRESPFNPRKAYAESDLEELSLSIASQGVLQPIVVRPAPNRPADVNNLFVTHELVFGHRRFRAAQLAGLVEIPAIVRDLDDAETAIAQVHENTQRKDVSAIEEADSFAHLHTAHKMSADDIASAIGKSRSYVYGRLKIAKVGPEVRQAVIEQSLPAEIALEVARIPNHKLQAKALDDLRGRAWVDGKSVPDGWLSYRDARRKLRNLFDLNLDGAPFDITDSTLAARAGACTTCPRRAGNDPDLKDVLEDDVCMDSECYQVKCDAQQRRQIAELRAAGHPVIEGEEAKALMPNRWPPYIESYRLQDDTGGWLEGGRPVLLSEMVEQAGTTLDVGPTTAIRNPYTGVLTHYYTQAQAAAIIKAAGFSAEVTSTPFTAARAHSFADDESSLTPEQRAVHRTRWPVVAAECMKQAASRTERTLFELRLVASAMAEEIYDLPESVVDAMGWRDEVAELHAVDELDEPKFMFDRIARLGADDLGRFIVLMAIDRSPHFVDFSEDLYADKLAIAEHYGVDVVAVARLQEQKDDAGAAGEQAQADAFEDAEA